ncbi:DNA methyltransferase [Erythrobacter sp. YT30]|uniref:site-specific DNA-methyltransferase n=1 Tax=Erythrobacter sp. YT30 TaxID=1735012 RepID=UPI00076CD060|nr:DNA methyltransferase [Erythrobacter sp. YT30]KWV91783.1 hypothetical protein AUC45_11305 [Erythrobacter sp. YT30]
MTISNKLRNELQVEYRSIEELRENPDNAKLHPKEQISKICRSIRQFGFLVPLLVDGDGMVLCGHGRLEAAKQLGEKTLPVVCIDHLTEAERRAFVIADNKLAEQGKWDEEQLAIEFNALLELEGAIEIIDTGFEIGEIDYLIEKSRDESETEEAEFLATDVEQRCRVGDLWQLGKHKLYCGDALDPKSYETLLSSEKAGLVFTDPPYNLPIAGVASGRGKVQHQDFVQASGEMSRKTFGEFLERFIQFSIASTKDGAIHFICMDWRQIDLLVSVGHKQFDELKAICVWDKGTGSMGSLYRSRHEFIAVFKSGSEPHINNVELGRHGRNRSNVWTYPGMGSFGRGRSKALSLHPTVKNLEMVADAILDCSNPGDLVLDPFAGSGTTALAAQRTKRRAALIELDPHYCDIILHRFREATGVEPFRVRKKEAATISPAATTEADNG